MANLAKERLGNYFPKGGLRDLGFSPEVSGYTMPNGSLMAYYKGEVSRGGSDVRRMVLVTNGEMWLAGARSGPVSSDQMVKDIVAEGVYGGKSHRYQVKGADLPRVLTDPYALPDIEYPQRDNGKVKINITTHGFE